MPVAYERWEQAQGALARGQQRQGRARWQGSGEDTVTLLARGRTVPSIILPLA